MNMGGYTYVLPRLITSMKSLGRGGYDDIKYVGRAPSAATATGFLKVHHKEQTELVEKALQSEPINFPY
jgi:2-oxoglutarate dehydrogenase E1 component